MFAVMIETGDKRVFASATGWPGWSRSATNEAAALDALLAYARRYARVPALAGLPFDLPAGPADFDIIERLPGGPAINFGVPEAIAKADQQPLDVAEATGLLSLLDACWQALDEATRAAAGKSLRLGPRGGGRDLAHIVEHVTGAQGGYLSRIGWKIRLEGSAPSAEQIAQARQAARKGVQSALQNGLPASGPRGGKIWPLRYFLRRSAWHILDHVWEIEDRLE